MRERGFEFELKSEITIKIGRPGLKNETIDELLKVPLDCELHLGLGRRRQYARFAPELRPSESVESRSQQQSHLQPGIGQQYPRRAER